MSVTARSSGRPFIVRNSSTLSRIGGVGALAVDDRQDLLEVMLQHRAVEVWLAGADPGDVAAQRVDLAVVDDVAVGVRALPARRGVGRVAGVDEGERRLDGGVGEVRVEATHLRGDEHALVDDGARAHGAYVEDLVRKRRVRVGGALDGATADVELALEILASGDALGATEERLEDGGHARLRRVAQVMRVDRHAAPEHERHAAFGAALLEDADRGLDGSRVGDAIGLAGLVAVREEEHRHAVITLVGEQLALLLRLLAEEAVRNLEQHARAISGVALKALAAAVLEVDEDREGVVESLVALDALQAGNGADSASVMLVAGTIQTGLAGVVLMRLHSDVLLRRSFRAVATPLADGAQASSRYSRSRICHVRYANTGATGAKQSCNTNPPACKGVSPPLQAGRVDKGTVPLSTFLELGKLVVKAVRDGLELALHDVRARGDDAVDRPAGAVDLLLGLAELRLIARELRLDGLEHMHDLVGATLQVEGLIGHLKARENRRHRRGPGDVHVVVAGEALDEARHVDDLGIEALEGQEHHGEVRGLGNGDVLLGDVRRLLADAPLKAFARHGDLFARAFVNRIAKLGIEVSRELRVDGKPHGLPLLHRQLHGKLDAVCAAGLGGDVLRILRGNE